MARSLKEEMSQDDYEDTVASAELAHYGQKRRSGEDYITHPKEVSAIVDKLYPGDDLASLVALLHDTLEDAPSLGTVKDIDEMKTFIRGSIGDSIEAEDVIEAVERLTHEPSGDYSSYVQGLLDNKLALRVKLADMLHNLSSNPSPKQITKYGGAIRDLWKASGKEKPKGISPLHWKLLNKAAKISNSTKSTTFNFGERKMPTKTNTITKTQLKETVRVFVRKHLAEQSPPNKKDNKTTIEDYVESWVRKNISTIQRELEEYAALAPESKPLASDIRELVIDQMIGDATDINIVKSMTQQQTQIESIIDRILSKTIDREWETALEVVHGLDYDYMEDQHDSDPYYQKGLSRTEF